VAWSVLSMEQEARALAEGQAQSRWQCATKFEVMHSQREEGLKITEAAAASEWLLPCIHSTQFSCFVASDPCFVHVQS
jgi:hypothetical protein